MKLIKLNTLDVLMLLALFLSSTGYLLAKSEKFPLNKIITGKENIAIEVLVPDLFSHNVALFKTGDESAITIRNRPYTKLKIIKVESKNKQLVLPQLNGTLYKVIDDPTRSSTKDYIVTLSDNALITNDGYVLGGNKIKIGNPIELEGFSYRVNGKVTNIYPIKEFQSH